MFLGLRCALVSCSLVSCAPAYSNIPEYERFKYPFSTEHVVAEVGSLYNGRVSQADALLYRMDHKYTFSCGSVKYAVSNYTVRHQDYLVELVSEQSKSLPLSCRVTKPASGKILYYQVKS